jgi:hypothetical protein
MIMVIAMVIAMLLTLTSLSRLWRSWYSNITVISQWCCNRVTRVLKRCYNGVTMDLDWPPQVWGGAGTETIAGGCQNSVRIVSVLYQNCVTIVSK